MDYIVNFFATPMPNYSLIIKEQSMVQTPSAYRGEKKKKEIEQIIKKT